MRYFTKELLVAISSCDRKKAEKAMLQLKENHKLYLQEWQRIKYKLPRTVRRYFEKYGSFHDYVFVEIRFCQGGHGKKVCFLELCNEKNKNICIKLRDVSSILINIESFQDCIMSQLTWLYSEFELLKGNKMKLSILCASDAEMVFEFKKISIG